MLKPLEYVYFILAGVEISAEISGKEELHFYSKSLLMLVLGVFYLQSITGNWNRVHQLVLAAICFSWIGDVALIFAPGTSGHQVLMGITKGPGFFLLGMAGFLLAHFCYIFSFTYVDDRKNRPLLSEKTWIVIPLVVYVAGLLSIVTPSIYKSESNQQFLVPVLIYAVTIALMVIFSVNRYKRVKEKSFVMVFSGAILFMFSDSILAINQFVHPFAWAGVLIMPLYIGGQYFIIKGCLAQFRQTR